MQSFETSIAKPSELIDSLRFTVNTGFPGFYKHAYQKFRKSLFTNNECISHESVSKVV